MNRPLLFLFEISFAVFSTCCFYHVDQSYLFFFYYPNAFHNSNGADVRQICSMERQCIDC